MQPVATGYLPVLRVFKNKATSNQNYHKSGQLQPTVRLHLVMSGPVSVIFSVQWTRPLNTNLICRILISLQLPFYHAGDLTLQLRNIQATAPLDGPRMTSQRRFMYFVHYSLVIAENNLLFCDLQGMSHCLMIYCYDLAGFQRKTKSVVRCSGFYS